MYNNICKTLLPIKYLATLNTLHNLLSQNNLLWTMYLCHAYRQCRQNRLSYCISDTKTDVMDYNNIDIDKTDSFESVQSIRKNMK